MALLSGLPEQLSSATEPLRNMLTDLVSSGSTFGKEGTASSDDLLRIGSSVECLSTGQQAMQDKIAELFTVHQTVLSRLTDLPDTMTAAIKAAQQTQAELLAHTVSRKDFEDVVREHISSVESERDLLRAKVDDIQAVMLLRATDAAAAQARATELEEALNRSLARLKTSDVTIESQQERFLELEKLNWELISEKQYLVGKVGFIIYIFSLAQRRPQYCRRIRWKRKLASLHVTRKRLLKLSLPFEPSTTPYCRSKPNGRISGAPQNNLSTSPRLSRNPKRMNRS